MESAAGPGKWLYFINQSDSYFKSMPTASYDVEISLVRPEL